MNLPTVIRRCAGLVLLGSVVSTGVVRPAQGQEVLRNPARQARLAEVFSGLEANREVQLVTTQSFIESALLRGVDGGAVELTWKGEPLSVGLDQVRSVAVKKGHPIQGTLWGIGTGVLLGTVGGYLIVPFNCGSTEECERLGHDGAVRWGTVFGVTGAVAGFVIGRYNLTWRPIFP
jgi:hypothetical protein